MTRPGAPRRTWLGRAVAAGGAMALAGCDRITQSRSGQAVLSSAEGLNLKVQRFFLRPTTLAEEFTEADISPAFRANGTLSPPDGGYRTLAADGFAGWRLRVDGLVETPLDLSLADLRGRPSRTQITRHDCVEGWSCIGKWQGVQLVHLLKEAKLKPQAKYLVFHCADTMESRPEGPVRYYESLDLEDAFHPQTILAYAMNGEPLAVPHGAPLRLRVERQLGYKQAKYLMRIEAVDSLKGFGKGKGGYWEDYGYAWYAGI
jgi:DMSO/TMAO reductase YedYZ molybdopterin-dependent catalytic subunit